MARGEAPVDFGCAETLAFAALLREGTPVRLSGQDSARGTFAQRHSAHFDQATGERWVPLNHLGAGQAKYVAVDSLLSEEAVLGFEYGYSVARPEALVIWEAQFGDFCNGAQVQIDQFIAAGEAKWGQASGLVLLLPHGYDGQGPEHSSARLERFLQLCAAGNMRVANPSTAAQYFHLLRRQALDPKKKPLVVMTPKSLLRLGQAASPVEALGEGAFAPVLLDPEMQVASARRVVLCSGKVFHDLALERRKGELGAGVALVRMELLYPWPAEALASVLSARQPGAQLVWCQEEPANMGAFAHARAAVGEPIRYVGRPASASPASGLLQAHKAQQAEILRQALS
jgi:2-oxoglutarate dehydrogenase E1 component